MTSRKQQLEIEVSRVPQWFHSIDLGHGIVTSGRKTPEALTHEIETMHLPDLHGKTVLDVGAWDGFFSFEAERRGARRVVSLDHFVWSLDPAEAAKYRRECNTHGVRFDRYENFPKIWRPDILPGKCGYDIAHKALDSKVECKVANFMTTSPAELGTFDVVFFMGVLYHMENPFESLKWLASVTGDLAIIETAIIALPGYEDRAFAEFYESQELNNDPTNWWAPNRRALEGMCRAAGFEHVEVVAWPWDPLALPSGLQRGRGVVHACKKKPVLPYSLLSVAPLPTDGFKARIRLESGTLILPPDRSVTVPVTVRNDSSQSWPPERQIHLAYHVLNSKGRVLLWEGTRTCLPRALGPGEETVVNCTISPLGQFGKCRLEFDMIQERVSWFKDKGSPTCVVACTLSRPGAGPPEPAAGSKAKPKPDGAR